jgi:hypothetical protein
MSGLVPWRRLNRHGGIFGPDTPETVRSLDEPGERVLS